MRSRSLTVWVMAILLIQIGAPLATADEGEKPYTVEELEKLVDSGVISDERIVELIYKNGIQFYPDDGIMNQLKRAGASTEVLDAIRTVAPEKESKPFYKSKWFLGGAAAVLIALVAVIASGGDDDEETPTKLGEFPNPPDKW